MMRSFGPPRGLETCYIETKNIGSGAASSAIRAGELIEQGLLSPSCREARSGSAHQALSASDASYSQGRAHRSCLGLVGTILDLKPVIRATRTGLLHGGEDEGRRSRQMALQKGSSSRQAPRIQHHGDAWAARRRRRRPRGPQGSTAGLRLAIQANNPVLVHTGPASSASASSAC